jgi:hypothetical protein
MRRSPTLAGIVAVVCLAGCGGSSTLTAKALEEQAGTLQSLAAEGSMLAGDTADGKMTRAFTRVHATDLGDAAASVGTALGGAHPAPGLAARATRTQRLAGAVHRDLAALAAAPGDKAQARSLAQQLERAAQTAKRLGGGA